MQLPRHFIGNIPPKAIASEAIRADRLKHTHLLQITGSHFLQRPPFLEPRLPAGFNSINRLIVGKMRSQVRVTPKNVTSRAMDKEKRSPGTLGLNRHDQ